MLRRGIRLGDVGVERCGGLSLLATLLFQQPSFFAWLQTFALNLPMALLWQLLYCGPFVRLVFRALMRVYSRVAGKTEVCELSQ